MSGFILTGVIALPLPLLVTATLGVLSAALSGFYALDHMVQHTKSFFTVPEKIKSVSATTVEHQVPGPDRLQQLAEDPLRQIQKFAGASELPKLIHVSKTMHAMFQIPPLLNKFLTRVAFGLQDQVEQLFTDVYSANPANIQAVLRNQGQFTDYSGRTFNCSASEYAYWAKDTNMCLMLAHYMDDENKAIIAARIDNIEHIDTTSGQPIGLVYRQAGLQHRSAHFDFSPLKAAYQHYCELRNTPSMDAITAALTAVGRA
jgi:hypothetical protein